MSKKDYSFKIGTLNSENCFRNNVFLVSIKDTQGKLLFPTENICNFSVDGRKIFITIYDEISQHNTEETLDKLLSGFGPFKKHVTVTLDKADSQGVIVYSVDYKNCILKKYHGKNLSYDNGAIHQWYLELKFAKKEIIKNEKYIIGSNKVSTSIVIKSPKETKRDLAILKNTNKMLDEAAENVRKNKNRTQTDKIKVIDDIKIAKAENENAATKYYGKSLDGVNLDKIGKDLQRQIDELENNIYK